MKKKNLISILSLILVAALAIAGTLALFTATDVRENTFTFTTDGVITIAIEEPAWDATGETSATNINLVANGDQAIDKDPVVRNTTTEGAIDVYTAVRLTWVFGDGTVMSDQQVNDLQAYITFSGLNIVSDLVSPADWDGLDAGLGTFIADTTTPAPATAVSTYFYTGGASNGAVAPTVATTELFSGLTISENLVGTEIFRDVVAGGGFNIKIEAAAVDVDSFPLGINDSGTYDALAALFPVVTP